MSDAVAAAKGPLARLDGPDRARAQRLAATVLRQLSRADAALDPFLRKPPPLGVLNLLRLGAVEIHGEGAAAHGVVNAVVGLVRQGPRTAPLAGLANAVLRRVAADRTAWDAAPPARLPDWLRDRLALAWGEAATVAMETAHAAGAALDLTVREPVGFEARALPTGSLRIDRPVQVSELPGYAEGRWWVQDAAAAMPARVLATQPGERVLDLGAAPGGKTLQLAATGADVTALDISGPRVVRLRDNLARTGLAATIVVADALAWEGGPFDAILLDAPCSATGTIRRHPDLPHVRDGSDIDALIRLQAALLDRAIGWLAPGGRLVFATCSLLPEEGEAQVAAALVRHPSLTLDREALALPGVERGWIAAGGGLRLRPDYWPDLGGMDGFFVACLRG